MLSYLLSHGETRPLRQTIVDIGEWNMDATATVIIPTGIPHTTIRSLSIFIINDSGTNYEDFVGSQDETGTLDIRLRGNASTVQLTRDEGGYFDGTSLNATASTVANRGTIYIQHIA